MRLHSLAVVLTIAATSLSSGRLHGTPQSPAVPDLDAFLDAYVNAWQSMNPFELADLALPGTHALDGLLADPRFDRLRETSAAVHDVAVRDGDVEAGRLVVTFEKEQEDLFLDGTLTRGRAAVQVELRAATVVHRGQERRAWRIVSHEVVALTPRAAANGQTPSVEVDFAQAMSELRLEQWEEARARLDRVIRGASATDWRLGRDRFEGQAQYFVSVCHARLGQHDDAAKALDRALELHPEFPLALAAQAERSIARGDLPGALGFLRASLDLHPQQPAITELYAFVERGATQLATPEEQAAYFDLRGLATHRAIEVAREQSQRQPANREWRRVLATLLVENHEPEAAERLVQHETGAPTSVEDSYLLARIALARGDVAEAARRFQSLWATAPDYRDTVVYLTTMAAREQRWRSALPYLREALAIRGESAELLFKLGVYALRADRRFEALGFLDRARAARPPARLRRPLRELLAALR